MRRFVPRLTIVALLVLACAGMVAQAGSLPHVHKAYEPGIYNEEHDLSLLAALAAQALLCDGMPAAGIDAVVSEVPSPSPERPAIRSLRARASRAPPTV
jgi:hypothetical protein